MEWSISEVARATGTTSRTLRHYGDVGLLAPSRTGANGYRYYDEAALLRLQRILLLRELGLGLPAIAEVLAGQHDVVAALETHLALLRQEKDRLERQITSVTRTIQRRKEGGRSWRRRCSTASTTPGTGRRSSSGGARRPTRGATAGTGGSREEEKRTFGQRHVDIAADYARARDRGLAPDADEVQAVVRRHHAWLTEPMAGAVSKEYFLGLGEMYVADPRFAGNYGGEDGARYVRDAMRVYAHRNL